MSGNRTQRAIYGSAIVRFKWIAAKEREERKRKGFRIFVFFAFLGGQSKLSEFFK